jgi:hypothetical protein
MKDMNHTETCSTAASLKLNRVEPSMSALTTDYVKLSVSYYIPCFVLLTNNFFGWGGTELLGSGSILPIFLSVRLSVQSSGITYGGIIRF